MQCVIFPSDLNFNTKKYIKILFSTILVLIRLLDARKMKTRKFIPLNKSVCLPKHKGIAFLNIKSDENTHKLLNLKENKYRYKTRF